MNYAMIRCERTERGVTCYWEGESNKALVTSALWRLQNKRDGVFECGNLQLRRVGIAWGEGQPYDYYVVMREGWRARLEWRARRLGRAVIERAIWLDVALYRWRGRPIPEGSMIPKASITYILNRILPTPTFQP